MAADKSGTSYRTQFDDGGEEIWSIRCQRPLPARLAVVVPPSTGGGPFSKCIKTCFKWPKLG